MSENATPGQAADMQGNAGAPSEQVDAQANGPALDFNGFVLYASPQPVPDELWRQSTGTSIIAPSSLLDEESGRTYANHETTRYFLPNDAAEQDRLDMQHKICTLCLDHKLYKAPIAPTTKKVLDIATGTGIWAIDFARQHPHVQVVGTDITLIQPDGPANCKWVQEDAEHQEWTLPRDFDFIHMRMVMSCFDDHRVVIRKSFDHLAPGGWLEIMDPTFELICTDGSCVGSHVERYSRLVYEASVAAGRDFRAARKYKEYLTDAGFVDVVEEVIPIPGGPWPTDPKFWDIGRWQNLNSHKFVRGLCWKLLRNTGMSAEEIEELVMQVKADYDNMNLHYFTPMFIVYGRKPGPAA